MDKQPPKDKKSSDIQDIDELVPSVTEEANKKAANTLSNQQTPQHGEIITSSVKYPLAKAQESTRALLAIAVAIGLGVLLYLLLLLSAINQVWTYGLLSQQADEFTSTELLELKKQQDQDLQSLMSLLVTAGFSTLGTALGFYFSSNRSPKD